MVGEQCKHHQPSDQYPICRPRPAACCPQLPMPILCSSRLSSSICRPSCKPSNHSVNCHACRLVRHPVSRPVNLPVCRPVHLPRHAVNRAFRWNRPTAALHCARKLTQCANNKRGWVLGGGASKKNISKWGKLCTERVNIERSLH